MRQKKKSVIKVLKKEVIVNNTLKRNLSNLDLHAEKLVAIKSGGLKSTFKKKNKIVCLKEPVTKSKKRLFN